MNNNFLYNLYNINEGGSYSKNRNNPW